MSTTTETTIEGIRERWNNVFWNCPLSQSKVHIDFLLAEVDRLKAEKDDLHDRLSAERRANDRLRAERAGIFNPHA